MQLAASLDYKIAGCEIVAVTMFRSRPGCLDARVILVRKPDGDGYVTAMQNRDAHDWYWGHYFHDYTPVDDPDRTPLLRALGDFHERACKLLRDDYYLCP